MTIRYLEIFVEVCKYMNMSRAAQSLMISQSSVSQAVKALEKEYNVLLFERLNHNLYLTDAGEKMLYLATQVLKSIGRLNSAMHNAPVSLNIGSCNTVGASFLYPLLAEFKKHSPDIHISAEISNTQTLTEKILNSSLETASMLFKAGERSSQKLVEGVKKLIGDEPMAQIDYVEIYALPGLTPAPEVLTKGQYLLALAVKFGTTRLIDNVILEVE